MGSPNDSEKTLDSNQIKMGYKDDQPVKHKEKQVEGKGQVRVADSVKQVFKSHLLKLSLGELAALMPEQAKRQLSRKEANFFLSLTSS